MSRRLRLVIADDEASIRSSLKTLFPWNKLGYEVTATFSNGLDTLNYLETVGADVLLCDIQMPVMDGISLLQAIHNHQLPVRTVMLSAYSEFEYARQGMLYGAVDYIVKPISYEEITHVFSSLYQSLTQPSLTAGTDSFTVATSYIRKNLDHATLEEAACLAGLSPDYLSRLFRKKAGCSFSEYLLNARMEEASRLIEQVHLPIGEIASRLGYKNPKNFTRAFHHFYHMTPMDYRRQKKEGPL